MNRQINYHLLLTQIRGFKIKNPTIIAGSKNLKRTANKLANDLKTTSAFIEEQEGYFGVDKSIVLCGHINQNVVLLIDRRITDHLKYLDIYDLLKCVGAKQVYVKEVEFTKLPSHGNFISA